MTKSLVATALLFAAVMSFSAPGRAQDASQLNDLEIAHVVLAANDIDIRYAHLALAISKNPDIRAFAETMIRDHAAVQEQAGALAGKLNLTPKANDVSAELLKNSEALVAELRALDGPAFDKRYAENELGYHKFVNGAVETIFIPNAKNAELKALLQAGLEIFKVHQGHAENMVQAVQ